ncbi:MAG: cupin [Bacteroidia bacterium]|nr:cupin [Bacteroidia bacterium]MDW8157407.1 cupin [Bacteroidia bacterium]
MATLRIPQTQTEIVQPSLIKEFLTSQGIWFDQWQAAQPLAPEAQQEEILSAYQHLLKPFMQQKGYQTADVVVLHPGLPNLQELHEKFFREHTHTEDEVRFFVEGKGYFWFHIDEKNLIFCVCCQAGDLIAVPAGIRHWFDMGKNPYAKVIRIFSDPQGWIPHYTNSCLEKSYSFHSF